MEIKISNESEWKQHLIMRPTFGVRMAKQGFEIYFLKIKTKTTKFEIKIVTKKTKANIVTSQDRIRN